jgi:hypothetical protein
MKERFFSALTKPSYLNSYPQLNRSDIKRDNVLFPFKIKHLWIKKATGLGVTEFMLRFMAWLCVRNDDYKGAQMVIVTGPNQELAIKLIKRMKGLFERRLGVTFDSKETVLLIILMPSVRLPIPSLSLLMKEIISERMNRTMLDM